MAESTNKLVTRSEWLAYMEVGGDSAKTYKLIGEGFTSFAESKNPKEYSRQYVNEKSERTDVVGYAPSIDYSCDVYSTDPVIQELITIADKELIGSDTHRKICSVNTWVAGTTEGTYAAFERTYAVVPSTKGDGTDALIYAGTLRAVGDIVPGEFDPDTCTFTAESEISA